MKKRLLLALVVLLGLFLLSTSIVCARGMNHDSTSHDTGNDGDHHSHESRFTDNGDGTVTDHLTRLMWTKDANLSGEMDWWDAFVYANNLILGSGGCGTSYTDWRLPNTAELESLVDIEITCPLHSYDQPCLSEQFLHLHDRYWSRDTGGTDTTHPCVLTGTIDNHIDCEGLDHYVWPVRSSN